MNTAIDIERTMFNNYLDLLNRSTMSPGLEANLKRMNCDGLFYASTWLSYGVQLFGQTQKNIFFSRKSRCLCIGIFWCN